MKKFFSMVTALCCTASMMAVLPASVPANAVVVEPEYDPWICRVSLINYDDQNQPESYILSQNMREFNLISAEDMQTYIADGSELPAVGDVLEVWNAPMKMGNLAEFAFAENASIINQGSDKDYYTETKQYLVTKKYLDENNTFCWTRLTDPETGQVTLHTDYDFYYDSVYSLKDTEIGDTVTCAIVFHDDYSYPKQVLSIEKGDGTLPELPKFKSPYAESDYTSRLVFAAKSGIAIPPSGEFGRIGDSQVFLYTDGAEFPAYGDVYEGIYYVMESYPCQFGIESMLKKVGTVEELYTVKDMTVALNYPSEKTLVLTDAEGNDYRYNYDLYNYGEWKFDIPIQNLQAGDTLKCAIDKNRILLVTELVNTASKETTVQEDYQVSVCISNDENFIFTQGAYISKEELEKYYSAPLKYGDVIKFPKSFLDALHNGEQPEDTNIENLGSAKDYYDGVKTLTVTSNENVILRAEDADGNVYHCLYPSMNSRYIPNAPIAMDKMEVGKSYDFIVSGNEIIIPDYEEKISVNPVPTVTATGDADGSGELDILDIITVNKAILGKEILSEDKISYVDFNGNGIPDADDALTMLKMLVGLI